MALNRDLMGKVYEGFEWEVTEEQTKAYAQAYGDDNPAFLERYDDDGVVAPPMFGVVFQLQPVLAPLFDQELGVNMMKLVHGEQAVEYHRLVRPGDKLSSVCKIIGMEEKSSGEILKLEVTTTDQSGETVVKSVGTMFIRGDKKDKKEKKAEPKAEAGGRDQVQVLLERTIATDKDQPERYAKASGDMNPIHLDDDFAKSVGLPGRIIHGLCTMAICQKVVLDGPCERDPARLKAMSVRFSGMVLPGDEITTRLWKEKEEQGLLHLGLDARTQRGDVVITNGAAKVKA